MLKEMRDDMRKANTFLYILYILYQVEGLKKRLGSPAIIPTLALVSIFPFALGLS
jgi:hypothetical protein